MNGFTAIHLAIAGLCALMAALHVAMWLAVRSEPAHKWVALSFVGFTMLALGLAGSSIASGQMLGDPRPWLLLTTPTALLLPPALLRTAWAVLDWPMTAFRRRLIFFQVALVIPVAAQFTWMAVTNAPEAASWEQARYANLYTAIPYNLALILISAVWIIEAIRALPTMRTVATTALAVVVPSVALSLREALVAAEILDGPTLVGVTALPLGAFASVSLVIRYVRAERRTEPSPVATEQYKRMARLGAGGMGELWLAMRSGEAGFQRWVVIKRIRMDRLDDHLVDRFLVEARVAARLHHANVVSVYDLGNYDDGWFIVMEYLSGPSLWEAMTRCYEEERFAPLSAVAQIAVDVCRGLESAHTHGVLHRDISPDNVIVTFDGIAKILDFGIAKEAGGDEPALTGPVGGGTRGETEAGSVVGKAQYLAPERLMGDPASVQSDIYALGLVLVQLLGAPIPERGADLAGHPNPVSEYRPGIPEAMEDIVRKALADHPKLRYRSALAMANDLTQVIGIEGPMNLSQWVRDLCPARWNLQRKLAELRDPTPAVVADLFAEMTADAAAVDTDGAAAPAETTGETSGAGTDRPLAPSTVRVGIQRGPRA